MAGKTPEECAGIGSNIRGLSFQANIRLGPVTGGAIRIGMKRVPVMIMQDGGEKRHHAKTQCHRERPGTIVLFG